MLYVGIDPGKKGAIAALFEKTGILSVDPLPLVTSPNGRDEYDLPQLARALRFLDRPVHFYVERQQPIPSSVQAGGAMTNFSVGYILGVLEAFLVAYELPYTLVTPRRWQATMLDGIPGKDTKQRSILAAQRLFPTQSLKRTERSRVPDSGFADALLIAEYGRRNHGKAAP